MGSLRWSVVVVLAAVALLAATAAVSALVPFASPSVLMLLVPPAIGLALALALAVAFARHRPLHGGRVDTPDPVAPVALAERIGARARATVVAADPGKAAWRRALR